MKNSLKHHSLYIIITIVSSYLIALAPNPLRGQTASDHFRSPEILANDPAASTVSLGVTYDQPLGSEKFGFYSIDGGNTWSIALNTPFLNIDMESSTWHQPDIASFPNGDFVIVWWQASGLFGKKFNSNTEASTGAFLISENTSQYPHLKIATLSNGGFIVVWSSAKAGWGEVSWKETAWKEGIPGAIYAQRFDENANPIGDEFRVNTYTGWQSFPEVSGLNDGGFVITWVSYGQDGDQGGIFAQRYDSTGGLIGGELQINTNVFNNQTSPAIASLSDGGFVIVWSSKNAEGKYDVYAQKVNAAGALIDGEIKINTNASQSMPHPSITQLSNNNIMIAWRNWDTTQGNPSGIQALQYDASWIPIGERIDIHPGPGIPKIIPLPEEHFFVIWTEYQEGIKARRYKGDGEPFTEKIFNDATNTAPAVSHTVDNGFVAAFTRDSHIPDSQLFYGTHQLTLENVVVPEAIQVQFKLVDFESGEEWLSPIEAFSSTDGAGGSIIYDDLYTNQPTFTVGIDLPTGGYHTLQLYQKTATFLNDTCGTFSNWSPYGSQTIETTEVQVPLNDSTCYQFKWGVTNAYGYLYEYTNGNTVKADRVYPVLEFTNLVTWNKVNLEFNITDAHSGVYTRSFQLNGGAVVLFGGEVLTLDLQNGDNTIIFEVIDQAGNQTTKSLTVTGGAPPPEIVMYGLEEGATYGSEISFGYILTQDLTGFLIYIDEEPISDVTYTVDGVVSTDLSGVGEGEHDVVIQGIDSLGNVVTTTIHFSDGIATIDTGSLSVGIHTLFIQGYDSQGNLIQTQVDFETDPNSFSLSLLSPQARNYEEDTIRIQYQSNNPVQRIWYQLNGGNEQEVLELSNLADGDYEMVFYAETFDGAITSVTRTFSVAKRVPTLEITNPIESKVYPSNTIELNFISDGPVTYQVGDQGTEVVSGDSITLPQDGQYTIFFTATHPISGYYVRKSITFETDSIVPSVEIQSPQTIVYNYNEIPIQFTTNKPLQTPQYLMDGQSVSTLSALTPGVHTFSFSAEDRSERFATASVDFTVVDLEVIAPLDEAILISNTVPPTVPLNYKTEGPFDLREVLIDNDIAQTLADSSGTVSIPTTAGNHDLLLRGHVGETVISQSIQFRVGAKNITVGSESIDYTIDNCDRTAIAICDVNVTLTMRNTGDYDVSEAFQVQFDNIAPDGFQTFSFTVPELNVGEETTITVPTFRSTYGSDFSVMIDPTGDVVGENPEDNLYQTTFAPGLIASVQSSLLDNSIFIEGISIFNTMTVETIGVVDSIELKAGGVTFVDQDNSNGLSSIVDLGLLTVENNCVQILAYDDVGRVTDTRNHCFSVKHFNVDGFTNHNFPWSGFFTPGTNEVNIDLIPSEVLMQARIGAIGNTLIKPFSMIPVLNQANGTFTYETKIHVQIAPTSSEIVATGPFPFGTGSKLSTGNGNVMVSLDPRNGTCVQREYLLDNQNSQYLDVWVANLVLQENNRQGYTPVPKLLSILARIFMGNILTREAHHDRARRGVTSSLIEMDGGSCFLSIGSNEINMATNGHFDFDREFEFRDTDYFFPEARVLNSWVRELRASGYHTIHYKVSMAMSSRSFHVTGYADYRTRFSKDETLYDRESRKKYKSWVFIDGEEKARLSTWASHEASAFYENVLQEKTKTKECSRWGKCSWQKSWREKSYRQYPHGSGRGRAYWP